MKFERNYIKYTLTAACVYLRAWHRSWNVIAWSFRNWFWIRGNGEIASLNKKNNREFNYYVIYICFHFSKKKHLVWINMIYKYLQKISSNCFESYLEWGGRIQVFRRKCFRQLNLWRHGSRHYFKSTDL